MYIHVPKPSILRLCIPNPKPPLSSRYRKRHLHEEAWLEMYVYVPKPSILRLCIPNPKPPTSSR